MRILILILALFIISEVEILAQPSFRMGLVLDDEEYNAIPYASENIQMASGQKSVPRRLDLSPYCPEVRNQGELMSCVGWSAGYAAMTIERAVLNGWTDKRKITENANSALFVYNQVSQGQCEGIKMPTALKLLQEKGNCLAREFDIDVNDCDRAIPDHLVEKAGNYKIQEYLRLFDPNDLDREKIKNVKLVLSQQKPVIVGMKVLNNFYNIKPGDQSWLPTVGDLTYAGGHAMVVVGYDDDKFHQGMDNVSDEMKGAFKLMNSWGKSWGERGYIWVRYAHFAKYCRHAYALMLEDGPAIDFEADMTPQEEAPEHVDDGKDIRRLKGSFAFKSYTGEWFAGRPVFQEEAVDLEDNYYVLKDRKVGEQFQLNVQTDFDNGYIYVFSVDPQGKTEVHFPKSADYNMKFSDQNESALLMNRGSILTIPSITSALEISQVGNDHLVVLFSESKIKPKYIEYLGQELATNEELVQQKLPKLLKKYMVPFSDIDYDMSTMGFEVSTRTNGKIVPVILRVESGE